MEKIALIIGTRPNFMKAIPIYNSLIKKTNKNNVFLIHTGQHYSYNLSEIFINELSIHKEDIIFLDKYSKEIYPKENITNSFSWIIKNLSNLFITEKINKVIVFGDVNSTLAASLAANLNNIYLIHIEAGLRSYDIKMKEERNRILIDNLANQLFITEKKAKDNLYKENITKNIYHCGNTMIDTLHKNIKNIKKSLFYKSFGFKKLKYIVITLHRQQNVDNRHILEKIINNIIKISNILKYPILFISHPRTQKNIKKFNIKIKNIICIEPIGYIKMINLIYYSGILLTDSGGLQEESSYLGIPCITLRDNTERPITISKGYNFIVSPMKNNFYTKLYTEIINKISTRKKNLNELKEEMGYGNSADNIVKHIL